MLIAPRQRVYERECSESTPEFIYRLSVKAASGPKSFTFNVSECEGKQLLLLQNLALSSQHGGEEKGNDTWKHNSPFFNCLPALCFPKDSEDF